MRRHLILIAVFILLSACGDGQKLQVVSQSPAISSTDVPTDTTISAIFSEFINAASVVDGSFTLANQSGLAKGALHVNGNRVTFVPNNTLFLHSKYTATISQAIYSVLGHNLLLPFQWNFTTRDGNWETLAAPPPDSPGKAAIDDNGRVMFAWSTTTGIYSSFFINGAWEAPVLLSEGGYLNSVVAVNDRYAVFWEERNGSIIRLHCTRYAGGAWQPTETLAEVDAGSLYVIPAMFSDNSLFLIYWYYGGADGSHGYSQRYIDGQGWQAGVALADQTAQWYVAGFHRTGKAVIAWVGRDGATETAYAQSFDVTSGWSSPYEIGAYTYLTAHSATVNSVGQGMVAFSTYNVEPGIREIRIASTAPGAGWTQLYPVYQKQSGIFYTPPQIAMDNLGNAMLVATEGLTSNSYFAIRYDANTGWQQSVDISGGRIPDPLLPHNTLKVDESGNYLLLWYGYDTLPGGIEHVYSSRYRYGIGWNAPDYLGRQDADAAFPSVSMNQRGEAVAVWMNFYPPGFSDFTMSLGVGLFH